MRILSGFSCVPWFHQDDVPCIVLAILSVGTGAPIPACVFDFAINTSCNYKQSKTLKALIFLLTSNTEYMTSKMLLALHLKSL